MWEQNYTPVAGSLGFSTLVAAIPLVILFYMLGVRRKPGWVAGLSALGVAAVLSLAVYGIPAPQAAASMVYGAAFGLFPIGWIVVASLILYRVTLDTGKFEIIKDSIGALSDDRRLQAVLIGFAFGAFIEGAAGFGTPVAIAAAMLTGLGFPPFYAAFICLLANTAPVAFGSLGIPVVTLAGVTGLPEMALSAMTGRLCALIALIIPAYMVVVMSGFSRALEVAPPIIACSLTFAVVLFGVTNTLGPDLAVILASIAALAAMVLVMKVWQPSQIFRLEGDVEASSKRPTHTTGEVVSAWTPYILLVAFVLVWRFPPIQAALNAVSMPIKVPLLHEMITRVPPITAEPSPYVAVYNFQWLSAAGTSCFLAAFAAALVAGSVRRQVPWHRGVGVQAAVDAAGDDRLGARAGLPDELRRHDLHARAGLCRHRERLPVFQRHARMDRRVPDRQRHVVKRAVRDAAGGHRQRTRAEPDPDRLHQRRHRGHGQDDLAAEHRGGSGRDGHGIIRGRTALPRHPQAQHHPDAVHGDRHDDLRLRPTGSSCRRCRRP